MLASQQLSLLLLLLLLLLYHNHVHVSLFPVLNANFVNWSGRLTYM